LIIGKIVFIVRIDFMKARCYFCNELMDILFMYPFELGYFCGNCLGSYKRFTHKLLFVTK